MGIKLGVQLKSSESGRLVMRSTPSTSGSLIPISNYTGHWRTDQDGLVLGSDQRTLDTNYKNTYLQWNEPLSSGKRYFEYYPFDITVSGGMIADNEAGNLGFVGYNLPLFGASVSGLSWLAYSNIFRINNVDVTGITLPTWQSGQYRQIAIDVDAKKIWVGVNGVWSNNATLSDIANGRKAISFGNSVSAYYLTTVSNYSVNAKFQVTVNNGQDLYHYPCPTGFTPMGSPISS